MKFCVLVTMHFYRTYFKAFPFFAEMPPKRLSFSVTPYLFLLLNVYSSINQSSREIDVHVFIIKTSNRSAIFVMLSLSKKNNNTFPYSPFYLRLFHPSVSPKLQLFFFPFSIWKKISNSTTQTSLKPMAFAQVQPTVKVILSIPTEISKCSSKFCSEVDKVQDTINMNYFMLHFSNVQH